MGEGYDFTQDVYNTTPAADISTNLSLDQDAARANQGAPWRMPTIAEYQELYNNCTCIWATINGVDGYMFRSNLNGNTLFFPAAGLYDGTSLNNRGSNGVYWSSTYSSAVTARIMNFNSSGVFTNNDRARRYGFSVRAVMQPT